MQRFRISVCLSCCLRSEALFFRGGWQVGMAGWSSASKRNVTSLAELLCLDGNKENHGTRMDRTMEAPCFDVVARRRRTRGVSVRSETTQTGRHIHIYRIHSVPPCSCSFLLPLLSWIDAKCATASVSSSAMTPTSREEGEGYVTLHTPLALASTVVTDLVSAILTLIFVFCDPRRLENRDKSTLRIRQNNEGLGHILFSSSRSRQTSAVPPCVFFATLPRVRRPNHSLGGWRSDASNKHCRSRREISEGALYFPQAPQERN